MSVNSSISHPRLTRGSYTSYFTLQISNKSDLYQEFPNTYWNRRFLQCLTIQKVWYVDTVSARIKCSRPNREFDSTPRGQKFPFLVQCTTARNEEVNSTHWRRRIHRVARRLLSRGEVPHLQGILTRLHDKNMAPVLTSSPWRRSLFLINSTTVRVWKTYNASSAI